MGWVRWWIRRELAPAPMPKRATRTVGGTTHRLSWADRHAGYRMKCSCGWIDGSQHWGERGAAEAGNRHVRSVRRTARVPMTPRARLAAVAVVVAIVVVAIIAGGSHGSSGTVPSGLVGTSLEAAQSEIQAAHLEWQEVQTSEKETTFGIVVPSDWTVCETKPPEGQHTDGPVKLIAAAYGC